jgi:hypothetical protein
MYSFAPGSTNVTIYVKVRDSSTGDGKTGLTPASGGAAVSYTRAGGTTTPLALVALAGPTAPYQAGGWYEMDAVNAKGLYRLDLPNAALAGGVPFVTVDFFFTGALADALLVLLQNLTANVGPGAIQWTVQVNNTATGLPLAGAQVWVTTDAGGTNTVAGALPTNAQGQVTFLLSAGPYFVWVSDPGFTGTNPTAIVVS